MTVTWHPFYRVDAMTPAERKGKYVISILSPGMTPLDGKIVSVYAGSRVD